MGSFFVSSPVAPSAAERPLLAGGGEQPSGRARGSEVEREGRSFVAWGRAPGCRRGGAWVEGPPYDGRAPLGSLQDTRRYPRTPTSSRDCSTLPWPVHLQGRGRTRDRQRCGVVALSLALPACVDARRYCCACCSLGGCTLYPSLSVLLLPKGPADGQDHQSHHGPSCMTACPGHS